MQPNNNYWIFLDEFNTSNEMNLLNSLICDRTFESLVIPNNIKIIAACNPFKVINKKLE